MARREWVGPAAVEVVRRLWQPAATLGGMLLTFCMFGRGVETEWIRLLILSLMLLVTAAETGWLLGRHGSGQPLLLGLLGTVGILGLLSLTGLLLFGSIPDPMAFVRTAVVVAVGSVSGAMSGTRKRPRRKRAVGKRM